MRLASKVLIILLLSVVLFSAAEAKAGCCSGHEGVDCSAGPQANGHVICNDGWSGSSCLYSEMVMCEEYISEPPTGDVVLEPNSTPEVPETEPIEEPVPEEHDSVPEKPESTPEESELPLEEPITEPVPDEPELTIDCEPTGLRNTVGGKSVYCEEGFWAEQKADGQACENNFECQTNFCSKNQCYDISSQVEENTSFLQAIFEWILGLFG